jgi:hypothetical protein
VTTLSKNLHINIRVTEELKIRKVVMRARMGTRMEKKGGKSIFTLEPYFS